MKKLLLPLAFFFTVTFISCSDTGTGPETGKGNEYSVSITVTPSGAGTVSPASDATYENGEEIELQAKANESYLFTGWSGDVESTDNPLVLTVDQDYVLTANFEKKSYPLTINTQGEGTVSEEIVEQKAKEYGHGTVVKLTAKPSNGWNFVKWQGDISSMDTVVTITVDKSMEITAVFENNFAGGEGTAANPYKVSTLEQLQKIGEPEFLTSHFTQVNDIDASATVDWNNGKGFDPIMFGGSYDGQGYVISNLTISRDEQMVGLFGYIEEAEVRNIKLENADITGSRYTGGLVGSNNLGRIYDSYATGRVHCTSSECGGLVGYNAGTIESSFAGVEVTSLEYSVGGLVGENLGTIKYCYASGNVTGLQSVGGLVGAHTQDGSHTSVITRSYAQGQVTGKENLGGLVGFNNGNGVDYSYATGRVSTSTSDPAAFIGGLIGRHVSNNVSYCYWDTESTQQSEGAPGGSVGTGLTTAQMAGSAAKTNMSEFDFVSIWKTVTGGYPALFWE